MKVYVVQCNYEGGAYAFSAHFSQGTALTVADSWNQDAREVRAQYRKYRDNGFREEDEPEDAQRGEHFYMVECLELEP